MYLTMNGAALTGEERYGLLSSTYWKSNKTKEKLNSANQFFISQQVKLGRAATLGFTAQEVT